MECNKFKQNDLQNHKELNTQLQVVSSLPSLTDSHFQSIQVTHRQLQIGALLNMVYKELAGHGALCGRGLCFSQSEDLWELVIRP